MVFKLQSRQDFVMDGRTDGRMDGWTDMTQAKTICLPTLKWGDIMSPKDADRMANSVDPDQTSVWCGSAMFVQTTLRKLRIIMLDVSVMPEKQFL